MEQARPAPEPFGFPPRPDRVARTGDERGQFVDASIPPLSARELRESELHTPSRRKRLSVLLFVATCLSTFWAGATDWMPYAFLDDWAEASSMIAAHWQQGLEYMLAVMAILLTHEMGHFLQAHRYRVPVTFPIFIPFPIMMTGTMGAVIGMDGSRANRKQLFDIGLTGPWAGLVVAIPMIWFGIKHAHPDQAIEFRLGTPWIFKLISAWIRPELELTTVFKNPLFMAGWVGMLITGLNMLPVSQLDGGHVIYGLFGRHAKWIARAFVIAAIIFIVTQEQYNWVVMLVLVLVLGVDHPPSENDNVKLGPLRWAIGLASLFIPVFCFTPMITGG
jgi:membrane-associated protease RseP (regulator of RpoE activity)